jgi:hypothetical protein
MSLRRPAGAEWGFWAVSLIDAGLCVALIFASDSGQDAAGKGLQSGLGVIALIVVVALATLYWSVRSAFVRVPAFVVALLPAVFAVWRATLG